MVIKKTFKPHILFINSWNIHTFFIGSLTSAKYVQLKKKGVIYYTVIIHTYIPSALVQCSILNIEWALHIQKGNLYHGYHKVYKFKFDCVDIEGRLFNLV